MANSELDRYPLLKIHGSLDSLSSAERKLAEFILDRPRETIDATIEELAESSGSSYATISRFCKKLGYSGFKEFRSSLIDDIVRQKENGIGLDSPDLSAGLETAETIERISRFSERILRETETFMVDEDVSAAADAIISAKRVVCVGTGTSAITAHYAYSRFFRLGIPCSSESDPVVFSMAASILGPQDVLLAVSSSGRTVSVVDAAEIARCHGATVISLSDYAISPLNRAAGITLYTTPRTANVFQTMEMPLLSGQVLISDSLFGVMTTKADASAEEIYRTTKEAADRMKY